MLEINRQKSISFLPATRQNSVDAGKHTVRSMSRSETEQNWDGSMVPQLRTTLVLQSARPLEKVQQDLLKPWWYRARHNPDAWSTWLSTPRNEWVVVR